MTTPNYERLGRVTVRRAEEADPAQTVSANPTATLENIVLAQKRERHNMIFWSDVQATVTFTTTAGDKTLPSVVVSGIPTGVTIQRVIVLFKFRAITDTSGAANEVETACITPAIQIQLACDCTWTDAFDLVDASLVVAASTTAPGDVWIGNTDVSSVVTDNGTYDFQIDDADAIGNNLILRDVQVGIKVEFSIS